MSFHRYRSQCRGPKGPEPDGHGSAVAAGTAWDARGAAADGRDARAAGSTGSAHDGPAGSRAVRSQPDAAAAGHAAAAGSTGSPGEWVVQVRRLGVDANHAYTVNNVL